MDSIIIVAIITGVFGLVTPIVVVLTRYFVKQRRLSKHSQERQNAAHGSWGGQMIQRRWRDRTDIEFEIVAQISSRQSVVQATFICRVDDDDVMYLSATGNLRSDQYLVLQYQNSEPAVLQFGYGILRLSSDTRELSGEFVGYGVNSEDVVSGTVHLVRK